MTNKKEKILKELYPEDLFDYSKKLTEGEVEVLQHTSKIIEEEIRPVINEHWETATFPSDEFYKLADAGIMNHPKLFEGRKNAKKPSQLYNFFLYYVRARFYASIVSFYMVHVGLGYNTILIGGDVRQVNEFATKITSFESQNFFALTEPDYGSDIAV